MLNPYLILDKFKDLLGTTDKEKSFLLLRKMRQEFKKWSDLKFQSIMR